MPEEPIYATWKGGSLTCSEFSSWLDDKGIAIGTTEEEDRFVEHLAAQYVATEVLAAAARERGLGAGPLDDAIRRQREDVAYAALLRRSVADSIVIGDDELDALVAQYPTAFNRPRRVRLFNLFKRVPAGATSKERQRIREELETLRSRVRDGEDFGQLASEHSDSENRLKGGLIGMVRPGVLPAEIDAEIASLEEGEVSRIFESIDGLQFFFAERVLPPSRMSRDERRAQLGENLRKQKLDETWEALRVATLEPAGLRFFPERRDSPGAVLVAGDGLELTTLDLEADLAEVPVRGGFGDAAARVRLQHLAENRLLAREARRRGLEPSAAQWATLERSWKERLALLELARRVEASVIHPTEQEVATYFEENAAEFERPREFELWAIRLDFDGRDLGQVREAALEAAEVARELGADPSAFPRLAEERSDLLGLSPPGYLGWVGERRLFSLSPNVRRAVEDLAVGQVSEPVREFGSYWVVWLTDLREPRVPTFEEAYEEVENRVGQARVDALRAELEAALLDELGLELRGDCDIAEPPAL